MGARTCGSRCSAGSEAVRPRRSSRRRCSPGRDVESAGRGVHSPSRRRMLLTASSQVRLELTSTPRAHKYASSSQVRFERNGSRRAGIHVWVVSRPAHALVVGASSGIGREIAIQASHAAARVALCARRPELLGAAVAASRASSARAFRCDVTDENDVSRSVEEASSWMGGLDVVVYTAGTAPLGRVAELEASDWSKLLATNVTGAALVVRHALGPLRSAEDGTVALVSTHTVGEPWPSLVAYSSSKAALEEMAQGTAPRRAGSAGAEHKGGQHRHVLCRWLGPETIRGPRLLPGSMPA